MLQVVDFSRLLQVVASLLTSLSCSKSVENQTCCNLIFADFCKVIRSQLSICSKPVDNLLETCYIKPEQVMRTHHEIGLMTEACNRLAANYAFLAVYSNIIIINVCECCVNYIKMLMQLTSITVINILTMFVSQFVYCIISDHTDGTAVQRATNNVDACTQCAYLFYFIEEIYNTVIYRDQYSEPPAIATELYNIWRKHAPPSLKPKTWRGLVPIGPRYR